MPTCAARMLALAHLDTVRNHHQIVDFRPTSDPRFTDRRTIDRRVRANLHVVLDDDNALLGDLVMSSVAVGDEPESVAADDGAVLHDDTGAQHRTIAHGDAGVQDRVGANPRAGTDHDVGVENDAIADVRVGADDHQRANRDIGAEARVRRDDRARMNAGRRPLAPAEHAQGVGKRSIRMRGAQHRAWRGRRIVAQDDRARRGSR